MRKERAQHRRNLGLWCSFPQGEASPEVERKQALFGSFQLSISGSEQCGNAFLRLHRPYTFGLWRRKNIKSFHKRCY